MSDQRFVQYHQKVLATDPIAYWIQDEKQGLVSYDTSRNGRNGAYTGTTPAQPGIGDGRTSQFFDAVNDFNNVFSASLQGAFNGSEGTCAIWIRVSGAGTWADAATRTFVILLADNNNNVWLRKEAVANRLRAFYEAAGVLEQIIIDGVTSTDWIHFAITWSLSDGAAGEMIVYLDGVQQGAIQVGLGVWVGNLSAVQTLIGATSQAPANVWDGYLDHAAVWDRALPAAQIADFVVVQ